ncbi:MAG: divalent cation tolerance protein CutA [Ktedonobacterales bacterium]|nr:divalent cation tolerance protein CutA [Ktedonobacterales bacterium]
MDYLVVLVTVPARIGVVSLVQALLVQRSIAGANVLPAVATWYRDAQGIHETQEALLVCRTHPTCLAALREGIRAVVGDDDFEISPLPVQAANSAYTAWIQQALDPAQPPAADGASHTP